MMALYLACSVALLVAVVVGGVLVICRLLGPGIDGADVRFPASSSSSSFASSFWALKCFRVFKRKEMFELPQIAICTSVRIHNWT